ncbi:sensor histidine kinase [Cohnella caldifontis]|uniref:sensor histidine kinase n=1 Tax=Cohnella caldifontis TaxID=3027471 RepID=UPI0023EB8892|nr:sensor histidine kinase [Cohnella sp. YIM B05605]
MNREPSSESRRPPKYGWGDFLRDRLSYAIALFAGVLLLAAVVDLDVRQTGRLSAGSLFYLLLLALFVLGAWLAVDYYRKKPYYLELNAAAARLPDLDAPLALRTASSREQEAVVRLVEGLHEAYRNELNRIRREQDIRHHFTMRWVHQMKTPLSVIDLLAQESARPGEGGGFAEEERGRSILEETERMRRGLDMMLHAARLDKFEIDVHVRLTALHELARDVLNDYKSLCIRHSVFPRLEGEASVETDPKWLGFVLHQLVGNAIKYSKPAEGAKKLLIRIEPAAEGGVTLKVRDQGVGIPPHDLPRVFDPFFTGDNGRITEESTGMGLYLAKQVCLKLGHRLTAESAPGEGTTLTVEFRPAGIHRI